MPSSASTITIANSPPPHHFQNLSSDDDHVYTIRLEDAKVEDHLIIEVIKF